MGAGARGYDDAEGTRALWLRAVVCGPVPAAGCTTASSEASGTYIIHNTHTAFLLVCLKVVKSLSGITVGSCRTPIPSDYRRGTASTGRAGSRPACKNHVQDAPKAQEETMRLNMAFAEMLPRLRLKLAEMFAFGNRP